MKTRNSHGLLQLGREALAYCQCASALLSGNKALFVSVDLIGEKNQVILEYCVMTLISGSVQVYLYHLLNAPCKTPSLKVLRPSDPNNWKNVEWIPYVFSKEYCSDGQTNRVMGQKFGTITFCHL